MSTADQDTELAADRVARIVAKWTKENRPLAPLARVMLFSGGTLLSSTQGPATVSAVLELLAEQLREQIKGNASAAESPLPSSWWKRATAMFRGEG